MKANSLAFRLLVGAAVWSVVALAVGGLILSSLFRVHVEESFDARLALLLDSLAAGVKVADDGSLELVRAPAESLFETPLSGWYWQVGDTSGPQLRSRSLWDQTLQPASGERSKLALGYRNATGPAAETLRIATRPITLPGSPTTYDFEIAGDQGESRAAIRRFNVLLAWSLGIMGLGLVAAMLIQVHFGLRPLRQIRTALAQIRLGRASRLETDFPAEIAPLAAEINTLLEHNTEIVERARTHVGNLAHALKTPLSVLTNEADSSEGELAGQVGRQTELMRRQVEHHLGRARAAATAAVLGARTEIRPIARDLARTLERINRDRAIQITVDCAEALAFRGEQQDLEEMIGNLMENGVKWANSQVRLVAEQSGDRVGLTIEDDGPGLPATMRDEVMQRGTRLDEEIGGSGLGLAIVRDVARLYGGDVTLDRSPLGGLAARLVLPAAEMASE